MTLPELLDLLESEGIELSLCLTLTMTRRENTDALMFSRGVAAGGAGRRIRRRGLSRRPWYPGHVCQRLHDAGRSVRSRSLAGDTPCARTCRACRGKLQLRQL